MFRIAFELLNLAGNLVNISKETARRLAVETGGGNEREVSFDAFWPRTRIEFSPIVPTFLRRKGSEMNTARALIERLSAFGSPILFLVVHLFVLFCVQSNTTERIQFDPLRSAIYYAP